MSQNDHPKDLQDSPDFTDQSNRKWALAKDRTAIGFSPEDTRIKNLAREAFASSTSWLNSGRRAAWNDSLRAFQGLHPSGSKYNSADFRYRSRLFRPKSRTIVRKSEAQTAMAFFANADIVSVDPTDDDNPLQLASSRVMKELLNYRLTKTIPWFQTLCGARQDAEVMGICVAKAYWKFDEQFSHTETRNVIDQFNNSPQFDENGENITEDYEIYNKIADHPWVDLLAPENFRFDPGADWRNPVATSPYTIELVPMYMCDAKEKIKSGEWFKVSEGSMRAASNLDDDTTRRSREQGRVPGKDHDAWKPRDYDIFWACENILRIDGQDMHCFTLSGSGELLTKPVPLKEVYLHGARPYVVGNAMIESHKTYPTSKLELTKDLQQQANDVVNLRLDNVKLALNPRQFIKAGMGIDPTDVRSFQPGKVLEMKDPEMGIKWDRPPDVTQSSYEEQDKINQDFDDLAGDMSGANIQSNPQTYQSVGNMELMSGNASQVSEYEQRIFSETFVEPILCQIVQLEQAYETDEVILAMAGRKAQLVQKFGINHITDELLQQELNLRVNVGLGATNPQQKLKNFMTAGNAMKEFYGEAAAIASNPEEVAAEIFSLCGYKDGDRFFNPNADIHGIMQQMMGSKQPKGADPAIEKAKLQLEQAKAGAQNQLDQARLQHDQAIEQAKIQGQMQLQHTKMQQDERLAQIESQLEQARLDKQQQTDTHQAQLDAQLDKIKTENDQRVKMAIAEMDNRTKIEVAQISAHAHMQSQKLSSTASLKAAKITTGKKVDPNPDVDEDEQSPEEKHVKEVAESLSALTKHLADSHKQNMDNMAKHNGALADAINSLAAAHRAPRKTKAVRDAKGKIVGSESYTE